MTLTEKAIRDFCGHHADWWPSTTQVQEMLALAQPTPAEYAMGYAEGFNDACKPKRPDYERGFVDGMQKQMQSSVDKAVDAMSKRTWIGLTDEEIQSCWDGDLSPYQMKCIREIEAKLKEKNNV
jgi:hypothetical protein